MSILRFYFLIPAMLLASTLVMATDAAAPSKGPDAAAVEKKATVPAPAKVEEKAVTPTAPEVPEKKEPKAPPAPKPMPPAAKGPKPAPKPASPATKEPKPVAPVAVSPAPAKVPALARVRNLKVRLDDALARMQFDISGAKGAEVEVLLHYSTDGGATWLEPKGRTNGDLGAMVRVGKGRSAVWNLERDFPGGWDRPITFRVKTREELEAGLAPVAEQVDLPEMVLLPDGGFRMGDISGKGFAREHPVHHVSIRTFFMSRTEITRGQFKSFVSETGYKTTAETGETKQPGCKVLGPDGVQAYHPAHSWRDPGFPQTDRDPVVCVSWHDAQAYIAWLNLKTGLNYRLPTEAEWEYAARAGSDAEYAHGDQPNLLCKYANLADRKARETYPDWRIADCIDGAVHTAPVASYRPNAFGLYDMLGNVMERVQDCYRPSYKGASADGAVAVSGCKEHVRVMRGGSWYDRPRGLRVAMRVGVFENARGAFIGFRVARDKE